MGGAGKTPFTIALSNFLKNQRGFSVGVVTRGYGRKTKGYRRVTHLESAESVGDEPLEIYNAVNQNVGKIQNENSNKILSNKYLILINYTSADIQKLNIKYQILYKEKQCYLIKLIND